MSVKGFAVENGQKLWTSRDGVYVCVCVRMRVTVTLGTHALMVVLVAVNGRENSLSVGC